MAKKLTVEGIKEMRYSELQSLAKKHNIKANLGREQLLELLAKEIQKEALVPSRPTRGVKRSASEAANISKGLPSTSTNRRPTRAATQTLVAPAPPESSETRTRSRVVSLATPRAALHRTRTNTTVTVQEDDEGAAEEVIEDSEPEEPVPAKPEPAPSRVSQKKKAEEIQRRLGVGRPVAVGGSGARRSTARSRQTSIRPRMQVEVVVPTLASVRESMAAKRASLASTSVAHPAPPVPPSSSRPIPNDVLVARIDELEERFQKAESVFAEERRKSDQLEDKVANLEATLTATKTKLEEAKTQLEDLSSVSEQLVALESEVATLKSKAALADNQPLDDHPKSIEPAKSPARPTSQPRASTPLREHPVGPSSNLNGQPSPFPPTPPTIPPPASPRVTGSRGGSPFVPQQSLAKTAISRARAMSAQPIPLSRPPSVPAPIPPSPGPSSAPDAFHHPGKHGRMSDRSEAISSPKKRRKVDEDVEMEEEETQPTALTLDAQTDEVVLGRRSSATPTQRQQRAMAVVTEPTATFNGRASSQPPRSTRGRSTGATLNPSTSTRRTRAGSVGTSRLSNDAPLFASRGAGRGGLAAVTEADDPPTAPTTEEEELPAPVTLPSTQPDPGAFIMYPQPGDPVEQLQALTHFDSGSEFLGTESKQQYRTDWHEGTVFDDPWDAETVRRTRGLAAADEGGVGVLMDGDALEPRLPAMPDMEDLGFGGGTVEDMMQDSGF